MLDPVTRDWQDGLLSRIFREACKPTDKNEKRWIVFDSDVDALWVENMNSVMDDNKVLTLPNGERIRLPNHCALLVEVADLQYASPATVSRCGMVYVDPKDIGYAPLSRRFPSFRRTPAVPSCCTTAPHSLFNAYVRGSCGHVTDTSNRFSGMCHSGRRG